MIIVILPTRTMSVVSIKRLIARLVVIGKLFSNLESREKFLNKLSSHMINIFIVNSG